MARSLVARCPTCCSPPASSSPSGSFSCPISALIYNAFTEDTSFGPGAFSLDNFVEAYSSWSILRLFRNSLIFAVGTAVLTFAMGALVAWVVERSDAPGRRPVPHAVAPLVRGSRPADGDGVDLRVQPEYRLGQCRSQIRVRAQRGAGQHLLDGGDDLGARQPLFPARLPFARAGAARARRAHGGGGAGRRRALRPGLRPHHPAAAAAGDPLGAAAPVRDGDGVLRGAAR